MKNVLGLDLGSSSIGWAVIHEDNDTQELIAMGSRIVPLSADELSSFTQGNGESVNAQRTRARGQRRGYDRYQLRRKVLIEKLRSLDMLPDSSLVGLPKLQLWGLRARAVTEQIGLHELGRVLLHLNQKRGYKSTKSDFSDDKKTTDYVKEINNRYDQLIAMGVTIGEHLFHELSVDPFYRCKEQVYPRKAYVEEFDRIMACQQRFYPEVLTDETIRVIRDEIIYYQRPLKSCKHLVSLCEFEKRVYLNAEGKKVFAGPKVAPRTSPLFQVCRLWESINNIVVTNRYNEAVDISLEQKNQILEFLNTHEKLKGGDLLKILGLSKSEGYRVGDQFKAGIQGNKTRIDIEKALGDYPDKANLLRFNLSQTSSSMVDVETGEIIPMIASSFEQEPLYRLWHVLYSIDDQVQLQSVLRNKFGIDDDEVLSRLSKLDFVKAGFGNKSSKAIRRILPFLQLGLNYADACEAAGYNHSNSLTKTENEARELLDSLPAIRKNELRQPVVEKILNQMINVVNALMAKYGRFDEIRVELARELKQCKEKRNKTYSDILNNEKENERIAARIAEYGTSTRSRIQKYKLWEETDHCCIYCGQPVDVSDFLQGFEVEVEHIIPKSLYFDNSFANKVCSCRKCNSEKGNQTAYDYMSHKGEVFDAYISRVNDLNTRGKISNKKMENLLTPGKKIPTDFISRQLCESQYISRKAREILSEVCYQVTATSGSVTAFLRHIWGWNTVLHDLNLPRYKEVGLTEMKSNREQIVGWDKRLDHRHHAIDALTIACTKQGYIQRLNNLQSSSSNGEEQEGNRINLERYIREQPHFSVAQVREAADRILISFKPGKRTVTPGKRYVYKKNKRVVAQSGLLIPRGALSEESIYGVIHRWEKDKEGNPIQVPYTVIKYTLSSIKRENVKIIDKVVDKRIREILTARLAQYNNDPKKAFATPVYADSEGRIPIRRIRCFAKPAVDTLVPLRFDEAGKPIAWVNSGNNHHVAIYRDESGKYYEQVVTFWNAVDRRQAGLPVIVTQPKSVWDSVLQRNDLPDKVLKTLPDVNWQFVLSLQQNEMFILGMSEEDYRYAMEQHDYALLNKFLYRVQKVSSMYYCFRYHVETMVDDKYDGKKNESLSIRMGKLKRVQSIKALWELNPHKVHILVLGEIKEVL